MKSGILLTSAALLDFLSQIDELSEQEISVSESDSNISVQIGQSLYNIDGTVEEVTAPDYVVSDIEDICDDAYNNLIDAGAAEDIESSTAVTGGIVKELAKTLLVGGLVRFTSKLLRK